MSVVRNGWPAKRPMSLNAKEGDDPKSGHEDGVGDGEAERGFPSSIGSRERRRAPRILLWKAILKLLN